MAYTELFLLGKALKWFKPYLIKIQENELTTTNLKARYIFFKNYLTNNILIALYPYLLSYFFNTA